VRCYSTGSVSTRLAALEPVMPEIHAENQAVIL
jgi:hypothetical protein